MNGLIDWKDGMVYSQPARYPTIIMCGTCYGTGRELINYAPGAIIEYPHVQKKCQPCSGHGVPPIPYHELGIV